MEIRDKKSLALQVGLLLISIFMVLFWLEHTPPGLMGKLNAIGYTVCHQIPSHSFKFGIMEFPICSRCTGMYLGVFSGIVILFLQRKRKALPSKPQVVIFGFFIAGWVVDGINSFITNSLGRIFLYQPSNLLRYITGFGMGLCIAVTIFFLFNYVIWKNQEKRSFIGHSALMQMIAACLVILTFILLQNEILMKIFAYISMITVVILLTTLYTIFWVIILHKENSIIKLKELSIPANIGFICALGQIILLDAFRLGLTGTWASLAK